MPHALAVGFGARLSQRQFTSDAAGSQLSDALPARKDDSPGVCAHLRGFGDHFVIIPQPHACTIRTFNMHLPEFTRANRRTRSPHVIHRCVVIRTYHDSYSVEDTVRSVQMLPAGQNASTSIRYNPKTIRDFCA